MSKRFGSIDLFRLLPTPTPPQKINTTGSLRITTYDPSHVKYTSVSNFSVDLGQRTKSAAGSIKFRFFSSSRVLLYKKLTLMEPLTLSRIVNFLLSFRFSEFRATILEFTPPPLPHHCRHKTIVTFLLRGRLHSAGLRSAVPKRYKFCNKKINRKNCSNENFNFYNRTRVRLPASCFSFTIPVVLVRFVKVFAPFFSGATRHEIHTYVFGTKHRSLPLLFPSTLAFLPAFHGKHRG